MRLNIQYKNSILALALLPVIFVFATDLYAARIKDIATIEGMTGTQVIGYGLVTGLNQTGDNQQSTFTVQSVSNMLKRFGVTIPTQNPRTRNVAAVMVTTTIPTTMKRGSKVDVQVSSIGDATSLQGGILLMSPVSTSDGDVVGMAQGGVSVGGYDFQSMGSRLGRNFVTAGRVPNGLILEKDIDAQFVQNQQLRVILRDPDFTTASNVAKIINTVPNLANAATAIDASAIVVAIPAGLTPGQITDMIAAIEILVVQSDPVARVVINERTGTIVVGGNVQLLPAVIAHGGLEISIQKQVVVPQPAPFTIRPPRPAETATIQTNEETNKAVGLQVQNPTVQSITTALNLLNVKPRDLIAIFQALKESGSLQGELIIQ
ncbi:MAG: Flagellar P-ring protein [Ignavibacteria bacterium]|nr:Flagellar P-ring protein [Ignavibacteria bacterium]